MSRYKSHIDLLSKNYVQAIELLLQKYGPAEDDYFIESSYARFLKGKIKKPARGRYNRTSEGLYCHHIDEIKWLNMADAGFIRKYKIPFEYQRKERLVFCDNIEHTILHALIAKETSGSFGLPGYLAYLKPMIEDWYIEEKIPKPQWMKNCYYKAFLTPEEAVNVIKRMQNILGLNYVSSPKEYHEEKERRILRSRKIREERKIKNEKLAKIWKEKEDERRRVTFNRKVEEFYTTYPKFKELNIHFETPRKKVLRIMFENKYNAEYDTYKEFKKSMMPVIKDELLKELYIIISN